MMAKGRNFSLLLAMIGGGVVLSAIAQLDLPFLVKEVALIAPLQVAALSYVIWYWRDR
jgi:hypothetical protein